jgi:hypothetical protein
MKKSIIAFSTAFIMLLCTSTVNGQSVRPFSYQAIARNFTGTPVTNQSVTVQFTIHDSSATGPVIYLETKILSTNDFGMFNTSVGSGNTAIGNFATIDWNSNKKFLQVGIDIGGGMNIVDMGTTELLSVPYALHSEVSERALNYNEVDGDTTNELQYIYRTGQLINLSHGGGSVILETYTAGSGINIDVNNVISTTAVPYTAGDGIIIDGNNVISTSGHYVGEMFGGGIVFHVYKDAQGVEHGLIASPYTLTFGTSWSNVTSSLIGLYEYDDGVVNTNAIINQAGHSSSAAKLCDDFSSGGFNDWYLPSAYELKLIFDNVYTLNKVLINDGNPLTSPLGLAAYWSSTEWSATNASRVDFYTGAIEGAVGGSSKSYSANAVRAIRAF